jgi:hypothetical protein
MMRNIRGQWWLAMGAGCLASISSWEIVAKDKEAVEDETVVVSVHTNVTAWTGEAFNFTLDTPAPLQSVTSNIVQALRESELRLPVMMLVAIGVAATSLQYVYEKKKGRMKWNKSEKMKRQTVGRKKTFLGDTGVSRHKMKKAANVIRRTRSNAGGHRCQCQSSGQSSSETLGFEDLTSR